MPSLQLLVSLWISNVRSKNQQAENVDENTADALENESPRNYRIEIEEEEEIIQDPRITGDSPSALDDAKHDAKTRRPQEKKGSLAKAGTVVKAPYEVSRRAFHATRKFILEPDKGLEEGYTPKYRYWPIISGCIVPFSILLEVPGLTEHWYNRTAGTQVIEYRSNPTILNVGLGLSMAFAVLANVCLLMRFLERRIKSATIASICFLICHDIINITALAIFGIAHRFDDGFTYSQAYWVTFASTITSLVVTATLIIDYWRTPNFAKSGSGLTRKQRSLVIIVMILLTYLGFGALIYCFMIDIRFLDALYFVVCSSLTIGFGDIAPSTSGAKVFSIFYNTFGILNTGLAIAIARETIVESFQQSYRNRIHALALRRKVHREAHAQHHAIKHGLWVAAHNVNDHLPEGVNLPISNRPPQPPPSEPSPSEKSEINLEKKLAEKAEKIDPKLAEKRDSESSQNPGQQTDQRPSAKPRLSRTTTGDSVSINNAVSPTSRDAGQVVDDHREKVGREMKKIDNNLVSGFDEEEKEYIQFRQDMIDEESKEFQAKLWVSWGLFVVFWVLGGLIFKLSEKWSYGNAIYFCFTAFSTIGYGDISPRTGAGRVCFIAWSLLGVGTMTILISVLSEAYQSRYSTVIHNGLFDKAIRSYQKRTQTDRQTSQPEIPSYDPGAMTEQEIREALDETKVEMSSLPPKIVSHARAFHAHLQYVITHNSQDKPPPGLQRALDELMAEEAMNDDLRKEVLEDGEARRTLFMMSFERTLKKMVEHAERISKLIDERDSLEQKLTDARDTDELGNEDPARDEEDINVQYPESPQDMRNDEDRRRNTTKNRPTAARNAKSNWNKLRTGILGPLHMRSHSHRRPPYLHRDGSQSEPGLIGEGKRGAPSHHPDRDGHNDVEPLEPEARNSKGKQPQSKLGAIRFADNPYDDDQPNSTH
ncbi:hypothetical protein CPB86DRAFT_749431 [Serendipita vermifera]|nr:hypothetical protein CPB86DRAFT_749431 [Serendipita vermifera]